MRKGVLALGTVVVLAVCIVTGVFLANRETKDVTTPDAVQQTETESENDLCREEAVAGEESLAADETASDETISDGSHDIDREEPQNDRSAEVDSNEIEKEAKASVSEDKPIPQSNEGSASVTVKEETDEGRIEFPEMDFPEPEETLPANEDSNREESQEEESQTTVEDTSESVNEQTLGPEELYYYFDDIPFDAVVQVTEASQ